MFDSFPVTATFTPEGRTSLVARMGRWLFAHKVIMALLLLATVKSLLWIAATPPWRSPDEPQHFGYIQFLSREHALPWEESTYLYPDVLTSMAQTNFGGLWGQEATSADLVNPQYNQAANHPPLYYLLMLPAYRLARGWSVETQMYSVRVWGTGIFLLLILASWRLASISFPKTFCLQIGVPLMLIFHPQLGFISACINNDNLLVLLFTTWLLLLVQMARGDLSSRRAIMLGVVTGLGMLTKSSFIVVYPLAFVVMTVMMIRGKDRLRIIRAAGILLGLSVLICGWYYVRVLIHNAPPIPYEKVERYGQVGILSLLFSSHFSRDLFDSFLGNFSYLSIPLLATVSGWFRRLIWLAGIGVAATLGLDYFRQRKQVIAPWLAGLYTIVFGSYFIFAALFELKLGAAQGRYLFPAIFPFWALFLVGLTGWFPTSWRPRVVALVVMATAAFSAWALMSEFLPRVT